MLFIEYLGFLAEFMLGKQETRNEKLNKYNCLSNTYYIFDKIQTVTQNSRNEICL